LIVGLLCNDSTDNIAEFGNVDIEGIGGKFLEIEEDAFETQFVFACLRGVFFFEGVPDLSGSFA
jgi:hypothetical protein